MRQNLDGLFAAVFTPMNEDAFVNTTKIPVIVEHLISDGVEGIYICGSTGEGASLTTDERKCVAESYIKAVSGRIKTIVQVGHNSLSDASW